MYVFICVVYMYEHIDYSLPTHACFDKYLYIRLHTGTVSLS